MRVCAHRVAVFVAAAVARARQPNPVPPLRCWHPKAAVPAGRSRPQITADKCRPAQSQHDGHGAGASPNATRGEAITTTWVLDAPVKPIKMAEERYTQRAGHGVAVDAQQHHSARWLSATGSVPRIRASLCNVKAKGIERKARRIAQHAHSELFGTFRNTFTIYRCLKTNLLRGSQRSIVTGMCHCSYKLSVRAQT